MREEEGLSLRLKGFRQPMILNWTWFGRTKCEEHLGILRDFAYGPGTR